MELVAVKGEQLLAGSYCIGTSSKKKTTRSDEKGGRGPYYEATFREKKRGEKARPMTGEIKRGNIRPGNCTQISGWGTRKRCFCLNPICERGQGGVKEERESKPAGRRT